MFKVIRRIIRKLVRLCVLEDDFFTFTNIIEYSSSVSGKHKGLNTSHSHKDTVHWTLFKATNKDYLVAKITTKFLFFIEISRAMYIIEFKKHLRFSDNLVTPNDNTMESLIVNIIYDANNWIKRSDMTTITRYDYVRFVCRNGNSYKYAINDDEYTHVKYV